MSRSSSGADVSSASGRSAVVSRQLRPRVSRVAWLEATFVAVRAGSVNCSQRRSESQNCWATVGVPSCGRFGFEPTESVGLIASDCSSTYWRTPPLAVVSRVTKTISRLKSWLPGQSRVSSQCGSFCQTTNRWIVPETSPLVNGSGPGLTVPPLTVPPFTRVPPLTTIAAGLDPSRSSAKLPELTR